MNLTQEREVPREKKNQEKVEKKNRTREKKNRAREKKIEHAKKKSSARKKNRAREKKIERAKKKIEREFREAQIGLRKGTTFLCGLRPSAQSAFDQTVCPTS